MLERAIAVLRQNPNASDEEVRQALGLRSTVIARMWKIKAKEVLGWL